jgi:hypothetical protein
MNMYVNACSYHFLVNLYLFFSVFSLHKTCLIIPGKRIADKNKIRIGKSARAYQDSNSVLLFKNKNDLYYPVTSVYCIFSDVFRLVFETGQSKCILSLAGITGTGLIISGCPQ